MIEETKKLFNAPWYVDIHAVDGFDGETYVFDGVYNDKCELVCGNIQKHVTSNRLSHLPELYDALFDATSLACELCHERGNYDGEPDIKKFIKDGCPAQFMYVSYCPAREWLKILSKVKEGK